MACLCNALGVHFVVAYRLPETAASYSPRMMHTCATNDRFVSADCTASIDPTENQYALQANENGAESRHQTAAEIDFRALLKQHGIWHTDYEVKAVR